MLSHFARKSVAAILGLTSVLSVATFAYSQQPEKPGAKSASEDNNVLIINDGKVDWIYKSDVSALREGVLQNIEITIGKEVKATKSIGNLHRKLAELALKKAEVAAGGKAALQKAGAQQELAKANLARSMRLLARDRQFVPTEEIEKLEAEVKVALALVAEAEENIKLAQAERDIANQALIEHTIVAPFDGIVIEELKRPGESVRANEPVVRLGNLEKLRVFAFIPLEYVNRVSSDTIVEFQPKVSGTRTGVLPVEQKKFQGKITFIDPQIQPIGETAIRIYADFDNPSRELKPGMEGSLTIHLGENRPVGFVQPQNGPGLPGAGIPKADANSLPALPR